MKDLVISGKIFRRELLILLGCFVVGMLTNVGAIIAYSRPFTEFFTQIGFVIVFSLILYLALWIVRLIVLLVLQIVRAVFKKKDSI